MTEPIDARTYMREYKRKVYADNPDKIKSKNKAYYYKYRCGMTDEDMKKYDILLPYVAKIQKALDDFAVADKEKTILFLQESLAKIQNIEILAENV
jgi:hypothetical protein